MLKIENNQIVRYVPPKAEIKTLTDSPCMVVRIKIGCRAEANRGQFKYQTVNLDLREMTRDQLAVLIGKAKREFDRR